MESRTVRLHHDPATRRLRTIMETVSDAIEQKRLEKHEVTGKVKTNTVEKEKPIEGVEKRI